MADVSAPLFAVPSDYLKDYNGQYISFILGVLMELNVEIAEAFPCGKSFGSVRNVQGN